MGKYIDPYGEVSGGDGDASGRWAIMYGGCDAPELRCCGSVIH